MSDLVLSLSQIMRSGNLLRVCEERAFKGGRGTRASSRHTIAQAAFLLNDPRDVFSDMQAQKKKREGQMPFPLLVTPRRNRARYFSASAWARWTSTSIPGPIVDETVIFRR